ncbi:MAG: MucR family transcriptional regulator [Proteobacteria bacterium]|nr:MucR family transcriptional regulator [Pseudomonadota bacterium]MBU1231622.1 MucR family transcriptional regulator [Pseudomonadota bacterium]MBU1419208.1 MucR family transcriptional regulator [Pseudomonadota bacterium]MBU1454914.1 MucR family transcriptional regulator [Pseudomonadota bacterium]
MTKSLVEMAAEIVQAQGNSKSLTIEEMQAALQETFFTLQNLQKMESGEISNPEENKKPVTSPDKSILKNKIICLECGEEFKMLSPKHLRSHELTGREYRIKYGFSLRQPLCAKALSEKRKESGKARGIPDALKKSIEARKKANVVPKKTTRKTVKK